MEYEVKSEILGFEAMRKAKLSSVDTMFATLRDVDNEKISFTLVNPFGLREYAFDIPAYINALLEIDEKSELLIYNTVVLQNPLDESCVNFLAPLIFNQTNGTMAQAVLKGKEYPDFGMAEPIREFLKG